MITARYLWDDAPMLKGFKIHLRTQPIQKAVVIVPLLLVGFGLFQLFTARQPVVEGIPPLVIAAMLWTMLRPWMFWQFRRAIRRAPTYGTEIVWTFDPRQITVAGTNHTATFTWSTLYSATISAEGLLLYPQKNLFHWIPATAFASGEDFATVRGYLAASGLKTRTV